MTARPRIPATVLALACRAIAHPDTPSDARAAAQRLLDSHQAHEQLAEFTQDSMRTARRARNQAKLATGAWQHRVLDAVRA